jgi:hypothetical protein
MPQGTHPAGLSVDVLDAIDEAIRSNQLRAVVATSTLADGGQPPGAAGSSSFARSTEAGWPPARATSARRDAPRTSEEILPAGPAELAEGFSAASDGVPRPVGHDGRQDEQRVRYRHSHDARTPARRHPRGAG